MSLDPAKLAKLMVLEELHPAAFEQVFHWQIDANGAPEQLRIAERLAKGYEVEHTPEEVTAWLTQPGIKEWLELEPPLAGEVLGPITRTRDRLRRSVAAARLSPSLQKVLVGLQSDVEPARERAVGDAAQLGAAELAEILEPLLEVALTDLGADAAKAMVALATHRVEVATAMFDALERLPVRKIKQNLALATSSFQGRSAPGSFLNMGRQKAELGCVDKQTEHGGVNSYGHLVRSAAWKGRRMDLVQDRDI